MPTTSAGFTDSKDGSAGHLLATVGPTLAVQVGFDPKFEPMSGTRPDLPSRGWPALVDTGAAVSCIDSTLAVGLGLPVVDREEVSGVHGAGEVNICIAQIYVPELEFTIYGRFFAAHLSAGGQPHAPLIGRSFLRHFAMAYDGRTGSVTISDD